MKAAIVYYSMSGNVEYAAERVGDRLEAVGLVSAGSESEDRRNDDHKRESGGKKLFHVSISFIKNY